MQREPTLLLLQLLVLEQNVRPVYYGSASPVPSVSGTMRAPQPWPLQAVRELLRRRCVMQKQPWRQSEPSWQRRPRSWQRCALHWTRARPSWPTTGRAVMHSASSTTARLHVWYVSCPCQCLLCASCCSACCFPLSLPAVPLSAHAHHHTHLLTPLMCTTDLAHHTEQAGACTCKAPRRR